MKVKKTVIFFQIGKMANKNTGLGNVLEQLALIPNEEDRIQELESGTRVVLDRIRYDDVKKIYYGSISKLQETGFPPQLDGGIKKLGIAGRLLHGVCFLYDENTNILAIESDNMNVSPNRFFEYLHTREDDFNGKLKVVLDSDKMVDLQNEEPKTIEIAVADPSQALGLQGAAGDFLTDLGSACDQFDGNKINVTISAGRSPKKTLSNVVPALKELLSQAAAGNLNLKKLNAKTKESIDNKEKPYNLLGQILRHTDSVTLPKDDPQGLYDELIKFVESAYVSNKPYLAVYV